MLDVACGQLEKISGRRDIGRNLEHSGHFHLTRSGRHRPSASPIDKKTCLVFSDVRRQRITYDIMTRLVSVRNLYIVGPTRAMDGFYDNNLL